MSNCILSKTAAELIPSGIRKISDKVNERIEKGERIFNLTVGDFSPKVFPIPQGLKDEIKKAYDEDLTNYPPSNGVLVLRQVISKYIKERGGFDYGTDEIVIGSGARPLSYTFFKAVVNPGEKIIYPAPSWNNNCYVQLIDAVPVPVCPDTKRSMKLKPGPCGVSGVFMVPGKPPRRSPRSSAVPKS